VKGLHSSVATNIFFSRFLENVKVINKKILKSANYKQSDECAFWIERKKMRISALGKYSIFYLRDIDADLIKL